MKFIVALVVYIPALLWAQSPVIQSVDSLSLIDQKVITSMKVMASGERVYYGTTGGYQSPQWWFVREDQNGFRIWETTINFSTSSRVMDVLDAPDGGILILGSYGLSYDGDGWNAKIDGTGKVSWKRDYTVADVFFDLPSGIILSTGEFLIAVDSLLIKFSSNGLQQWTRSITIPYATVTGISLGAQGNYLVSGTKLGNTTSQTWIYNFSELGDSLWVQEYDGGVGGSLSQIISIEDGYVVAGQKKNLGQENFDFWIFGTDSEGRVLWEQEYGDRWEENSQHLLASRGGGFLIGGIETSYAQGVQRFARLIRTNEVGKQHWEMKIPAPEEANVLQSWEPTDGFYSILGKNADGDLWINHLSEEDISPIRFQFGERSSELSPLTPFQDGSNITVRFKQSGNYFLEITDVLGKSVSNSAGWHSAGEVVRFQVANSGIFYLKAELEGVSIVRKVILK